MRDVCTEEGLIEHGLLISVEMVPLHPVVDVDSPLAAVGSA